MSYFCTKIISINCNMGRLINIDIDKVGIYDRVAKLSGYTGARETADSTSYSQTEITPAQYELLDEYWREGCAFLIDAYYTYVSRSEYREDALAVELNVTGNWLGTEASLREESASYLEDYIYSRWLEIIGNAKSKDFREESDVHLAGIRRNINRRKRSDFGPWHPHCQR